MWAHPLTNDALSKLNTALVEAGFSTLDIERARRGNVLIEDAIREEDGAITTTVSLRPDSAFVHFKFGKIKKFGMRFNYPPIDADDDKIIYFIDDILAASSSADD